ncbi:MAG TPA: hypothetical protein PLW86_04445, partial [Rhodocyclaceae bacterium]|nr:hypothetical protein [Rhodocyclaceae bacterium]
QDLTRDITSSNEICILEGSAFQNTIRFMIEGLNQDIDAYFEHFQHAIQALEPRFIYLRPADLDQALAYTCHSRGNEWASKVAGYLETTPFCQSNELKGLPGMFSFWKSYALQCDTLFNQLRMPKLTVSPQAGRWEEQIPVICNFLGIPYPLKAENKACA